MSKSKEFTLEEWQATRPAVFDKSEAFESRIRPLIEALVAECKAESVPVLVNVCYMQDEQKSGGALRTHFPDPQYATANMLAMLAVGQNDIPSIGAVLNANQVRCMMSAITKH